MPDLQPLSETSKHGGTAGDFDLGEARVRPRLHRIETGGRVVRIEPKAMRVLLCLVEGDGEVVTREQLLAAAWPETYVSEDVLNRAICQLRKALGDEPRVPRFIETIPRVGYRLLALVDPVPASDSRRPYELRFPPSALLAALAATVAFSLANLRLPWQRKLARRSRPTRPDSGPRARTDGASAPPGTADERPPGNPRRGRKRFPDLAK